jgi:hypothetical protein
VHERVETPEPPTILVIVKLQARFVELVTTVRVTVAEKPLTGLTVISSLAEFPKATLTLCEAAVME